MFNLLMSGNDEAFRGEPWTLERARVFEHTNDAVRARFAALNPQQIDELCRYPALIAYERGVRSNARLGKIDRVRLRQDEVRIEYSIAPGLPEIPPERIEAIEWELDFGRLELNRTHWAVKDVDLAGELVAAGIVSAQQLNALPDGFRHLFGPANVALPVAVQPTVFRLPEGGIQNDLVSVMLPFAEEFRPVFGTIQQAGQQLGLRVLSVNDVWDENEIIQDIFSLIYRSKIVVCDFSSRNPNVFYEAGIAHTLGRQVIPIVQRVDDIPFDLRHHRHIVYLNNGEGRQALASPRRCEPGPGSRAPSLR